MGTCVNLQYCFYGIFHERQIFEPIITVRNEVAKVIFYTCLSVILFTKGGVSQHALQVVSQQAFQQGGLLLRGVPAPGGGGSAPGGVPSPEGCACSGGACSRVGGYGDPPKADSYCCERYASYWNAFLFAFASNCKQRRMV